MFSATASRPKEFLTDIIIILTTVSAIKDNNLYYAGSTFRLMPRKFFRGRSKLSAQTRIIQDD